MPRRPDDPDRCHQPIGATASPTPERPRRAGPCRPASGIVEAVDTSFFFRFKDNVVVRVRPVTDTAGSVVDMRSVSRVGVSDVGVNARRVRRFLADLQRG